MAKEDEVRGYSENYGLRDRVGGDGLFKPLIVRDLDQARASWMTPTVSSDGRRIGVKRRNFFWFKIEETFIES